MVPAEALEAEQTPAKGSPQRVGLPFSAVLGVAAGLAIFTVSLSALRDIDLYWHLLAGAQLASGVHADSIGTDWSFATSPDEWTSTQWLSELLLYWIHAAGGWTALAAMRVASAALAIGILARATLRGRPAPLAGLPFLVAVTAIAYASQERPQQATFIGAAVLGGVLAGGITQSRLPRWYLLIPGTVLWANLHGGWILVPIVMGLIAVGRALDQGFRDRLAWKSAILAIASFASGALTPAGGAGLTAAFRLRDATNGLIQEWQPTRPLQVFGLLTVVMLIMMGIGWARSGSVPYSELLTFFACLFFSWTAWRNVAPGLALVAPIVAHRLSNAFPNGFRREPPWSVPVGLGAGIAFTILGLVSLIGRVHLPIESQPIALTQQIGELPPGQRVLNDYNAAGMVLYFGGPGVQVGIDGRADRYGSEYIEDYIGLRTLSGDWEQLLDELAPTSALFEEDKAIVHVLQAERGWKVIGRENGWVLMVPGANSARQ